MLYITCTNIPCNTPTEQICYDSGQVGCETVSLLLHRQTAFINSNSLNHFLIYYWDFYKLLQYPDPCYMCLHSLNF